MSAPPVIRLLIPSGGVGRYGALIRAICMACHERHRWQLDLAAHITADDFLRDHRRQPAQGVIAFPIAGFRGGPLHDLGVPTVTFLIADSPLPVVKPDDEAIGRLAARHLALPGWAPVAATQIATDLWQERQRGWLEVLPGSQTVHLSADDGEVRTWLAGLPPRCAVFTANDHLALRLARLAGGAGRVVGSDLRLLGVDDDIDCLMGRPTLSSISLPMAALGRLVVKTMAALLAGRPVPDRQTLPPRGLVVRGSTDPLVGAEPWLRDLAEHLRMTIARGRKPDLERLLAAQGRHRATVYRAWRAVTGGSVMSSVQQIRRELALNRLAQGESDLASVARSVGLTSVRSLQRLLAGPDRLDR